MRCREAQGVHSAQSLCLPLWQQQPLLSSKRAQLSLLYTWVPLGPPTVGVCADFDANLLEIGQML